MEITGFPYPVPRPAASKTQYRNDKPSKPKAALPSTLTLQIMAPRATSYPFCLASTQPANARRMPRAGASDTKPPVGEGSTDGEYREEARGQSDRSLPGRLDGRDHGISPSWCCRTERRKYCSRSARRRLQKLAHSSDPRSLLIWPRNGLLASHHSSWQFSESPPNCRLFRKRPRSPHASHRSPQARMSTYNQSC
jgi:hypothetical protein